MRRFENILYVTDGTGDETDSLKQTLSLARNNAARLQALVSAPVLPSSIAEHEAGYRTFIVDRLRRSITSAQAALKMRPDEVQITLDVECGATPAVRIVRRALRNAHDLLIKQALTMGRRAGFRALDMQLLRLCPCPIWLSRPISRARNEIRVAVAVDPQSTESAGQELALQLLRLSRTLADTCSGELNVISCWDYEFEEYLRNSPWARVSEEAIVKGVLAAERDHRAALEALIGESGVSGKVRVHHVRGRADRQIPRIVNKLKIDIIVMGTVGRTGIPGFLIGNTAENVLRELSCSLVALKPNGFVSPVRAD